MTEGHRPPSFTKPHLVSKALFPNKVTRDGIRRAAIWGVQCHLPAAELCAVPRPRPSLPPCPRRRGRLSSGRRLRQASCGRQRASGPQDQLANSGHRDVPWGPQVAVGSLPQNALFISALGPGPAGAAQISPAKPEERGEGGPGPRRVRNQAGTPPDARLREARKVKWAGLFLVPWRW